MVAFEEGEVTERWATLVDPEDDFDGMNIHVHGITPEAVRGAPTFPTVAAELRGRLSGPIVVTHTPFDRNSLRRAHERYAIEHYECRWLDTARVARRAWPDCRERGYGLKKIAQTLEIEFKHHDACEDAWAAGMVLLRAMAAMGAGIEEWYERAIQPCVRGTDLNQKGDPDGLLAGETVVFTGALQITRKQAADLAARAGCDTGANVTVATTLLVVGDQDVSKLAGHEKSIKHRKAEGLIEKGQAIRIIGETHFLALLRDANVL